MTAGSLREALEKWRGSYVSVQPLSEEGAERQLQGAQLIGEMRESLLARLKYNGGPAPIRFLASYSDLQSLDRIDEADSVTPLDPISHASLCRTVFQASEVALLNIAELAERTKTDLEAGRIGEAEEKYRWISALQRSLASFSNLLVHFPPASDGSLLTIRGSSAFSEADQSLEIMRSAIIDAELVSGRQIIEGQLYEPARNLTHQVFSDLVFEDLSKEGLGNVIIPDVYPGEAKELPYDTFVGAHYIRLSVQEIDHVGDTFFRQFRAFHQMSEIFAKQANHLLAAVVDELTREDGSLPRASSLMRTALSFLEFLPENLDPLLKNLSVSRYQDFRVSLGITSGSHSPNIRKNLFNTLYPLVVRSVEMRVKEAGDELSNSLNDAIAHVYDRRFEDPQANSLVSLCEGAVSLHFTLRHWRDLHLQFVKTHLGISETAPTASVAGAKDGVSTAARIREHAHAEKKDPIKELYEAMYRRPYSPSSPFMPYASETFAGQIAARTAKAVKITSAAIQERVALKAASKIQPPTVP